MKVLLDENIPRKLKWRLIERDLEVVTVPERGWAGVTNGDLLSRAEQEFDVLLTMDQGMEHQQNVAGRSLGIVTIVAPNNEYETLLPLVPEMEEELRQIENGTVVSVAS
jgi:predicted nuclease of predicted toxin-antitoxin system